MYFSEAFPPSFHHSTIPHLIAFLTNYLIFSGPPQSVFLNNVIAISVILLQINGGAASHIVAAEQFAFSDLDLIFHVPLADAGAYEAVKQCVLDAIADLLPAGTNRAKIDAAIIKDAYVRKMIKVEDDDRWSLFSLNNHYGRSIELKFVDRMRRQFEFSVDSFQIGLDALLDHQQQLNRSVCTHSCTLSTVECNEYDFRLNTAKRCLEEAGEEGEEVEEEDEASSCTESSSCVDSMVTWSSWSGSEGEDDALQLFVESMYGDINVAVQHLNDRLIDTKQPEQIRGGGLLKYCHLLCRGYKAARPHRHRQMQRYMCSRFFIDFPDLASQEIKLRSYLDNHLGSGAHGDDQLKYDYLRLLYKIVSESTVCLMTHERRQTLAMIDRLIQQLSVRMYYQHRCQNGLCAYHQPKQTLLYLPANATYWIPVV